jgi:manganese/zinc/iron transport system substrate-binding protein
VTGPRMMLVVAAALLVGACGAGTGLGDRGTDIADREVRVIATTNFVTDLVEQIGGDRVQVHGLMGAGVDPHQYKATAGDVGRIADADVVFHVGLHLEARLGDVLESTARRRPVVAIGEALDRDRLIALPSAQRTAQQEFDPHVWFDTDLWADAAHVVADTLAQVDPDHADDYRERADEASAEIRAVGNQAAQRLAAIPQERRVLVTSHDAFQYFGRRFELDVEAIQGISTVSEATTSDIDRVAALLAERGVRAVFIESSVPRRTIEAVVAAARQRGARVRVGGELFADAAGDAGTPEGTYLGMLGHNVDTIVEGLS